MTSLYCRQRHPDRASTPAIKAGSTYGNAGCENPLHIDYMARLRWSANVETDENVECTSQFCGLEMKKRKAAFLNRTVFLVRIKSSFHWRWQAAESNVMGLEGSWSGTSQVIVYVRTHRTTTCHDISTFVQDC